MRFYIHNGWVYIDTTSLLPYSCIVFTFQPLSRTVVSPNAIGRSRKHCTLCLPLLATARGQDNSGGPSRTLVPWSQWCRHPTSNKCMDWFAQIRLERGEGPGGVTEGHFAHKPRVVTMKLWEPKRKCPKAVLTHLQNHVVWSRTVKCSVKSYVTGPSTKYYFKIFIFIWVFKHDNIK